MPHPVLPETCPLDPLVPGSLPFGPGVATLSERQGENGDVVAERVTGEGKDLIEDELRKALDRDALSPKQGLQPLLAEEIPVAPSLNDPDSNGTAR